MRYEDILVSRVHLADVNTIKSFHVILLNGGRGGCKNEDYSWLTDSSIEISRVRFYLCVCVCVCVWNNKRKKGGCEKFFSPNTLFPFRKSNFHRIIISNNWIYRWRFYFTILHTRDIRLIRTTIGQQFLIIGSLVKTIRYMILLCENIFSLTFFVSIENIWKFIDLPWKEFSSNLITLSRKSRFYARKA